MGNKKYNKNTRTITISRSSTPSITDRYAQILEHKRYMSRIEAQKHINELKISLTPELLRDMRWHINTCHPRDRHKLMEMYANILRYSAQNKF